MANTVVWADIPVLDMERARVFYAAILQGEVVSPPGMDGIALLPGEGDDAVSADLALGENQRPSQDGCTIYLDAKGDPEGFLARVREAGGTVLMEPTFMGDMVGTIAFFLDTEGNKLGLHKAAARQ
jgi:uncharacterized protein